MRGIMADVCGKEEGAERRLRHAHVNGSLMKQYDRCIIEILPHPPLLLAAYLSLARDPRLCLFPDTPFLDLSPHLSQAQCVFVR